MNHIPQNLFAGKDKEFAQRYYYKSVLILEIKGGTYTVNENGTEVERQINQSITLECGLQFYPSMAVPQKGQPGMQIGVCDRCREEGKSHGLVSMSAANKCVDCRRLLCPKHQKAKDSEARCKNHCAKKYRIKDFIHGIFFKAEE